MIVSSAMASATTARTVGAASALIAYGRENALVLKSLDGELGKYVELRKA